MNKCGTRETHLGKSVCVLWGEDARTEPVDRTSGAGGHLESELPEQASQHGAGGHHMCRGKHEKRVGTPAEDFEGQAEDLGPLGTLGL